MADVIYKKLLLIFSNGEYANDLSIGINNIDGFESAIWHPDEIPEAETPDVHNNSVLIIDAHLNSPKSSFKGIELLEELRVKEYKYNNPAIILSWFSYKQLWNSNIYYANNSIALPNVKYNKNCRFLQFPVTPQQIVNEIPIMRYYEH